MFPSDFTGESNVLDFILEAVLALPGENLSGEDFYLLILSLNVSGENLSILGLETSIVFHFLASLHL